MGDEFLAQELAKFEQEVSTLKQEPGYPPQYLPPQQGYYPNYPPPPHQTGPPMHHLHHGHPPPPRPNSFPPPPTLAPPPQFPPPFQQANPIQNYLDSNMPVPAGPQNREPAPSAEKKAEPQHGVLSEAIAGVKRALAAAASGQSNPFGNPEGGRTEKKKHFRTAAGERWVDDTLSEWPENDHRIFVGDLGNEVNDDVLAKAFVKFASFAKAKVVRDKRTNKTKGYGFVSFLDPMDFARAIREMDGKYIGNRPAKIRKSDWMKREDQPGGKKKGFNVKNSKKKIRTLT